MKKTALMLGIMVLVLCGAYFYPTDTVQLEFRTLRAEANENATTINLTTSGDFDNIPATAVEIRSNMDGTQSGVNAIEILFAGGDAANDTFTYKIYAWRSTTGMARMVATGAGTLGTQAVVEYPHNKATATSKFYADTLTVTDRWLTRVASTNTTGNNEVASLCFDLCGHKYIYCEITAADGSTGSEAGNVSAYYSTW